MGCSRPGLGRSSTEDEGIRGSPSPSRTQHCHPARLEGHFQPLHLLWQIGSMGHPGDGHISSRSFPHPELGIGKYLPLGRGRDMCPWAPTEGQGPPRPFFRSLSPASSVWSPWREERPSPLPAELEGLLRVETKCSSPQRDHKEPPSPRDPPTPRNPHHGSSSSQLRAFLAGPCAPSKHMFGGVGVGSPSSTQTSPGHT